MQLKAQFWVLHKSVFDNHPIGSGMSGFVFEHLCGAHKWCTFVSDQPRVALQALAEFDPQLSSQWEALLAYDVKTNAALTRDLFDDELTNTEASLSRANVAETVIAGWWLPPPTARRPARLAARSRLSSAGSPSRASTGHCSWP